MFGHKVWKSLKFQVLLHKTFLEEVHSARSSCTADARPLNGFEWKLKIRSIQVPNFDFGISENRSLSAAWKHPSLDRTKLNRFRIVRWKRMTMFLFRAWPRELENYLMDLFVDSSLGYFLTRRESHILSSWVVVFCCYSVVTFERVLKSVMIEYIFHPIFFWNRTLVMKPVAGCISKFAPGTALLQH